ncbi:MAG: hypothetical protein LRZ99_05400 [Desulfotomaculum sp.]|nr:hypothetical protein [Desulfotomaculum sp.]MCL0081013.1 hypothetical protein [Peptococcaceae bacterium]
MKKTIGIASVMILLLAAYGGLVWAGGGDPGGATDPLVTRSFVERHVDERLAGIGVGGGNQWQVEKIETGGIFEGIGGTEVVLRSGQATCIDPTGNGILNVTSGGNVFNGQQVPQNNMLIIPRDDGRGFKADTPVYIMYRGGGTIKY